jgi:hypothetical protein
MSDAYYACGEPRTSEATTRGVEQTIDYHTILRRMVISFPTRDIETSVLKVKAYHIRATMDEETPAHAL